MLNFILMQSTRFYPTLVMPINYKDYHPSWKKISRFVRLIRAGNTCEGCGIKNYTVIEYLDECQESITLFSSFREARDYANSRKGQLVWKSYGLRWAVVILTVAHLDHDTSNNDLENLKALCQRCHLGHDRRDNAQRRIYGSTGRHHNQMVLVL